MRLDFTAMMFLLSIAVVLKMQRIEECYYSISTAARSLRDCRGYKKSKERKSQSS